MCLPAVKLRHPSTANEGRRRWSAALALLVLGAGAASPALGQTRVAVTIDDLPWVGVRPGGDAVAGTEMLLAALRERGVPATGFVICDHLEAGAPVLHAWLDAGMELGNHTAAHRDLNRGMGPWLADTRRCDDELAAITGHHGGWFRFPYLRQGPDLATRDAVAAALDSLGYRTAHVTIDNSEWVLAAAYGRAMRDGDTSRMRKIGEAYVAHMLEALDHFDRAAREKFGRPIDHVLLLHANALNADWLGAVLDAYAEAGCEFVGLEEALADPVFALPDDYAGPRGLSWVYRARPLSPEDPWDVATEDRLQAEFGD
ncbi:MAG: polysaccharide deacetylase family protein [Gemmatimonadales bacterium]